MTCRTESPGSRWPAALACLALLAAGAGAHEGERHAGGQQAAPPGPDEQAIIGVLERYARAMTGKDLTAIRPLLVPDDEFSYFEGTYVNRGWQSYYEHLEPEVKLFEQPEYRISEARAFASGDLGYATFDWALQVTVLSDRFEGGRHPVSMQGKGTAVFARLGNQWKIRHLHTAQAPARKADAPSH